MKKMFSMALLAASAFTFVAADAQAATNDKEVQAIARIMSLSKDIPAGEVTVGVVYDAANATSNADFEAIKSVVGGGFKGPKHTIKIKPVPASDLGAASGSPMLIVTEGVGADVQGKVRDLAVSKKVLTATTDLPQVEGGSTILGVDVGGGTVKIIMHGGTYKESGLSFDAAFEFMVKEI